MVYPFELTMQTDSRGAVIWTQRPLKDVIEEKAIVMFKDGMSERDVAKDLHISRHRARRIKNSMPTLPQ